MSGIPSFPDVGGWRVLLVVAAMTLLVPAAGTLADPEQQASAVEGAQAPDLPELVARLGSLDYATRMNAARLIRRAPAPEAVAALTSAVKEATDQFVRYRALVLMTGFGDRQTEALMRAVQADRNDRLREVAYRWMAARPQRASAPTLLAALQTEEAEFVRPALVRALAALGSDPGVQRALVAEVSRGQDFFRVGVIDALGEFKAAYAYDAIASVLRVEGPLQDDAALALGRIGDRRAVDLLADLPTSQPELVAAVQAAYCLLGDSCDVRVRAIADIMVRPGARPEAVRGAVTALTVLGASGSEPALSTLADLAGAGRTQEMAAVGFGGAALRSPEAVLGYLARVPAAEQDTLVEVLHSAFERFEEDFAEEQFFAATRAAYWRAAEGSPEREFMARVIRKLEF